jgi:hypothetical protein
MKADDLTGKRFGRLTVQNRIANRYDKAHWKCRCDCGGAAEVSTAGLKSGHTSSCGCIYRESRRTSHSTHGMSRAPEYRVWKNMIARCENTNRDFYKRYGGRGISVCAKWRRSFPAFMADMGPRPTLKHSIDRIDNDRGYTPKNCQWATNEEQGQNTSRTRKITIDGVTLGVNAWARRLHLSKLTVVSRFG